MARMRLFTALEDLAEDTTIIDAGADSHDEVVRRETTDDVEMTGDQIGDITGTIDQAINTVDNLMAIGDSLSKSSDIPGIGIDEVGIEPTIIAVEALYRKLDIKSYSIPSLEAFNNNKSRLQATKQLQVSIEAKTEEAKGKIRQMLDKAWEFLKKLYEKVVNAIKDVFVPGAKKLLKRANELKNNEVKGEKEFKDNRIYKAFATSAGEKVTIGKAIEALKNPARESKDISAGENDKVEYGSKSEVINLLNEVVSSEGGVKKFKEDIDKMKKDLKESKESEDLKKRIEETKKSIVNSNRAIAASLSYASKNIKALGSSKEEDKK